MSGNEVTIVVRADDQAADGVASSRKAVKGLGADVDQLADRHRKAGKATQEYGKGLEGAGEAADKSEQRIMGVRDTVDGAAAIMAGPGANGLSAYLQGWADLASGIAGAVIPALQAFSLTNLKATASTAASKVAMVATTAATKAWTATQWLLNAALTANPIGLVVVAIGALVAGIVLAYKNSETFRKICDAAFKAIGDAVKWLVDKVVAGFKIFWESIKAVWDWFKKLTGASDDAKDATEQVTKATERSTIAYQDQVDALDAVTDAVLGLSDGEMGLEDAIDKATEAVKNNGRTLDVHTEKGRNNRKALEDIARETLGWRQASIQAGESVDRQRAITEQGRTALIKAATQMGMSKTAAKAYADQLFGIPKTINTNVFARTPNLSAVQREFRVLMRPGFKDVTVRYTTTGSTRIADNDKATGGIIGAAGGGPRGRTTLVGEHGPELVDLPFGSMVHSNPDSMRMLAGAGGSDRPYVLQVIIGGAQLAELLVDPLRKVVRVIGGGDVQAAFGSA